MQALRVAVIVVAIAIAARGPGLASDVAYGEYLASECTACHGADPEAPIPALRTFSYQELVDGLKAYRDGTRTNTVMKSVARSLGDAEIEALAAYFSRRP
ncbi:MAG TPA: c-type cytochrome [Geminicoccaceae bacterium]